MSRTRYAVVDSSDLELLLNLTWALAEALPEDANAERTVAAAQSMREILLEYESPFLRHREVILGHYSTANRLRKLVLHLWNDGNEVRLANLFGNADKEHTRIAMELIASYASQGENDPHFMHLADEIRDLQKAAA